MNMKTEDTSKILIDDIDPQSSKNEVKFLFFLFINSFFLNFMKK